MGWVSEIFGGTRRFLARFGGAKSANVAIIFALSLIPLLAAAGAAVDLSRALVVRARLSQALDAAGLAVGATLNLTQPQMQDLAQKYFDANYPATKLGVPGSITVNLTGKVITMTANASVDTALMYLVGIDHLAVGVNNEITRENKGLEVAMVLDNTGSMAQSGKIGALKTAADELIDTLSGGDALPDHLKIGIVPFTVSVKVNPTAAVNGGWIDTTGTSSVAQKNFSGGKYAYWLYTNAGGLSNTPWGGCVEARPNRLDETDTAPSSGTPDTRFVPWFVPSEPNIDEPELAHTGDTTNVSQSTLTSNFSNNYIATPNLSVWIGTLTQGSSTVSTSNDTFTFSSNHGLSTGMGPVMVTSSTTLPAPLSASTNYWVIRSSNTVIKLATSLANANAGTAVNITSAGSGTLTVRGASQVSDTFLIPAHGMATADGPINMYLTTGAGAMPTGMAATTDYWVIKVDANTIKLASSRANAVSGTAVNFTANGSGSLSTSESPAGTTAAKQVLRQQNWQKYVGRSAGTDGTPFSDSYGPNAGCDMQAITPLTNDMNALKGKIDDMVAQGSTNVPIGLAWGWKLISPTAPYTEGASYTDSSTVKAIILMTDGDNDMPGGNNTLNAGGYNAYGFPAQNRMGTFNAGGNIDNETEASGTRASNPGNFEVELGLNESEARLCSNIKAIKDSAGKDRIRIYTIALMVTDTATINMLQACATSTDLFFNTPSASQLQTVFQAIAQDLSNLRVSK